MTNKLQTLKQNNDSSPTGHIIQVKNILLTLQERHNPGGVNDILV